MTTGLVGAVALVGMGTFDLEEEKQRLKNGDNSKPTVRDTVLWAPIPGFRVFHAPPGAHKRSSGRKAPGL